MVFLNSRWSECCDHYHKYSNMENWMFEREEQRAATVDLYFKYTFYYHPFPPHLHPHLKIEASNNGRFAFIHHHTKSTEPLMQTSQFKYGWRWFSSYALQPCIRLPMLNLFDAIFNFCCLHHISLTKFELAMKTVHRYCLSIFSHFQIYIKNQGRVNSDKQFHPALIT